MPISGSPVTANSPTGLPISADYSSDKSGPPEKVFISPVTKNGPFGLPVGAFDTSTNIHERRDTVFSLNFAGRAGDVGVDDGKDNVVASGLTGAAAYSNAWFNSDWFSSEWFNAYWFNAALFTNGDVDFTEDPDDVVSSGRVEMSGYGDGQEDHDTVSSYGAVGNPVTGYTYIYESRDDSDALGRVIVGLGANILEDRDIVVTDGSTGTVTIKLSWTVSGVFTGINIYRSEDNVTFEHIKTLPGTAREYVEDAPDISKDYYYYITGIPTTGIPIQSDTAFVDLPGLELVPDPEFDDAGEWETADVYEGTAVVSGGVLTCTGYRGRVIAPNMDTAVAGQTYAYDVTVDSFGGSGLAAIQYGTNVIWVGSYGTGTFKGSFEAVAADDLNIAIAFTADNMVISRLSIKKL